jgi:hypothetical protein
MRKYHLIPALLLMFAACQNSSTTNESENPENNSPEALEQTLYQEVIKIHDEVMPKLQEISNLKGKVEEKITEFEGIDQEDARLNTLREQLVNLDEADQSMMDWMHNFKTTYDGWTHKETMEYLQKEKERIRKTGELVDESIASARSLLEE